jgi:hypothetical protein
MFRYSRIRFALLASVLCAAAMGMPARADDVTPALAEAAKYLKQGNPAKALEITNRTIKSGQIPSELAAKALLLRARAYEAMDKYAYALADYNQALWMKTLPVSDKSEAEAGRSRIMAKLGVGDAPDASAAKASAQAPQQSAPRPAPQPKAAVWNTDVQTTASEERTGGTGGLGGFFGRIFGSSEKSEQQAEIQPARPPVQQAAAETTPAAPSRPAVAAQPRIRSDQRAVAAEPKVSQTRVSLPPSGEQSGDFAIQIAALHSEDRAIFEANRVEKRYSEWLGGRTPSITVRETSDGNTLYKVIIEPYQRSEGTATCEMLKTKGLSCMLISR